MVSSIRHKDSESEDQGKASIYSEASDEKVHSKKGSKFKNNWSLVLMTVEQIKDLIVSTVMVQLGGGSHRSHLCTKSYTKTIDALYMPRGYQPAKSSNVMERTIQSSMPYIASGHVTVLASTAT